MNNEEKILQMIDKLYVEIVGLKGDISGVQNLQTDMQGMKGDIKETKIDLQQIKETVARIEIDHGQKLNALFDGYKQNTDKLDRINAEVAKHKEIILRRVR